jgi:S1-C subfamily serine protease
VKVRFCQRHESEAHIVGTQPENDLAVLKAASLPDDLQAATMRSTADLRPATRSSPSATPSASARRSAPAWCRA